MYMRLFENKDQLLLRNMFNIYQNDLSIYNKEFNGLDENGWFDYDTINCYLNNKKIKPFLIYEDDKAVGFIILTKAPYVKEECDYCIQEFFIIKALRGNGFAEEVFKKLINEYSGKYCLKVYTTNQRAFYFWIKMIKKYSKGYHIATEKEFIIIEFII